MKRIGQIGGVKLYDLIKDRDNIAKAVKAACKDHRKDPAVQRMKENPEPYIEAVSQILEDEAFHYSKFRRKTIFERGKWRELCYTRTFPDRIVQHAVMQVVAPILLGTCTADTYAAREGKGIYHASVKVRRDLKTDPEGTQYCLKMDVRHYFDNIDRDILFNKLKRKLKCRRTLDILHAMIYECPGTRGLPIGLYSSQIFSSFYLSDFDHYVKEALGVLHYYRYMDDLVIMWRGKEQLHRYLAVIRNHMTSEGLEIKGNWQIFPVEARGIDFLGYVMRRRYARVRKRVKISYRRSCEQIIRCLKTHEPVTRHMVASKTSYEGMLSWCDARHLTNHYGGRVFRAVEFGLEALA